MSLLADALQPFFVPGLNAIQGRVASMTLADLIGGQARTGFDLDFNDTEQAIVTDFRESSAIVNSMASDSSRFASAALQSIQIASCGMLNKQTMAWALIQAYYASFYAGHAIIRLLGESCSYFNRFHVARIIDLGQAVGKVPSFKLKASAYRCVLNPTATVISSICLRDGPGGAHEAFWNTFGLKLATLSEGILRGNLGESDRQIVFAKIEDFRRGMSTNSTPLFSFLSAIRNEIQYRHANSVWLPSSLRKSDRENLGRLLNQWRRDPMAVDLATDNLGHLGTFISICAFTVSVCVCLLQRIAERSASPPQSFARLGPLALIDKATLAK